MIENSGNWRNVLKNIIILLLCGLGEKWSILSHNPHILYIGMPAERKKQRFFADFLP